MALLDSINKPGDVKNLPDDRLTELCGELREKIIEVTAHNGGHLSSNLGAIELTVALDRVFDFEPGNDIVIFDVGHQSYSHKILSGHKDEFSTLRQRGGLSGFTKPSESRYDFTVSGHASVSLSSGIGFAKAKKLKNEPGKVICVIGDGAFTGGMVYEAMNNLDRSLDNLIVILNDNSMSISKNKSAVSRYFMKLRVNKRYSETKARTKRALISIPLVGKPILRLLTRWKNRLRRSMYSTGTIFEEFGFNYVGVADGNNVQLLSELLEGCKTIDEPVFMHIDTQKGKGYEPAEHNPGMYHGVSGFDIDTVNSEIRLDNSFSNCFGYTLADIGSENKNVCAITAAMKYATGLHAFANAFPDRFFDVGICEEHAVVFAAGLAQSGLKPVVSIYSTFLQRSYDQIFHDIVLNNNNVLFAVDRAGLVGNDGETHQGIFDAAFLSQFSIPVASPSNYSELEYWTRKLVNYIGPAAVRYSRGKEIKSDYTANGKEYDVVSEQKSSFAIVTYGRTFFNALEASKLIYLKTGCKPDIIKLTLISPVLSDAIDKMTTYKGLFFVEEGILNGGVSEHYIRSLSTAGYAGKISVSAIDTVRVQHMTVDEQMQLLGFTPEQLCSKFIEEFCNEKQA